MERLRCGAIRGETGASEPRLFTCVIAPGILWPTHEAETPIRQGGRFRKIRGDGPTWMGGAGSVTNGLSNGSKAGPECLDVVVTGLPGEGCPGFGAPLGAREPRVAMQWGMKRSKNSPEQPHVRAEPSSNPRPVLPQRVALGLSRRENRRRPSHRPDLPERSCSPPAKYQSSRGIDSDRSHRTEGCRGWIACDLRRSTAR